MNIKRSFVKVSSLILAVALIMVSAYGGFAFGLNPDGDKESTATYYVQYGGTGDGLSAEAPLATVDDAVKSANAAGLGEGDTVYINVMQSADWNFGRGKNGAGGNYRADPHHMTTWAALGAVDQHDFEAVVQGYGEDDVYLASNGQLGLNLDMVMGGPTEFNNITIVRMRKWRGIYANGYDLKFGEGTKVGTINVDDCDPTFKKWTGKILSDGVATYSLGNVNKTSSGGGGVLEFCNAPDASTVYISSIADDWHSGEATGPSADVEKFTNDVTIVFDNAKFSASIGWGNQYGGGTLFEKNLNINTRYISSLSYISGKGTVTVNGDLQIISKAGIAIDSIPDNVTVNGGKWFLSSAGGSGLLDFTAVSGTYAVKEGVDVQAVDNLDPSKTYNSVDGLLTVPAGSYTINRISAGGAEATYFVQYGGTGDGLTAETPLATVADAINAANDAGLGKGDTVYINVMQSADWDYGKNELGAGGNNHSDPHHITTWGAEGAVPTHAARIVVEGYGDGEVYLASNAQLGLNRDMVIGGDTEFKNITIVRMRRWRGIFANGYNLKFGEGTKVGVINVDDCDSTFNAWNGNIGLIDGDAMYSLGNVKKLSSGGGGVLEFDNAPSPSTIYISSMDDIWQNDVPIGPEADIENYPDDVTIIFNNPKFSASIVWGNQYGGSTVFQKNFNINTRYIDYMGYKEGKGTVTINGDLQIISKAGSALADIPDNVTVNGGKWFLSNAGGSALLDFTSVSGTFAVKEGVTALATDMSDPSKTYVSAYGLLTMPAGTYLITRYSPGGAEINYYVKYGGTGDGLTFENPLSTVEEAVNAANDQGYSTGDTIYVNVIQSDDWQYGANRLGAGGNYRSDPHHITTWSYNGRMPMHKAKLVVQGVGDNYNSPIYLATNVALGRNQDMVLGGPTVFKNISIVRMRRWRGLMTNGYDLTYDAEVQFGCLNVDDCDEEFKVWDGTIGLADGTSMICLGDTNRTSDGGGSTLTFANSPTENTLYISSIYSISGEVEKFTKDVNIIYNNPRFYQKICWGNLDEGSSTFEKNLNFNILGVNKLTYITGDYAGKGQVNINGGLQIIANCGEVDFGDGAINKIPKNVVAKAGQWFITNNGNAEIEFTPVAGTFRIKDGKEVTVMDVTTKQKYSSAGSTLTVPAGNYVVEETDDGVWWKPEDVEEEILGNALIKGTLKNSDSTALSKVKLALISDDGTYYAITDAEGNFTFSNVKPGFYELFTFDSDDNRYETGYFSSFSDGDTVTLKLQLNDTENDEDDMPDRDIEEDDEEHLSTGIVKGRVYTPDLKTVSNITVYLGTFGSTVTDKDGYFEFLDVPEGEYDLYTFMEDGSRQVLRTVTVKENTELSMKLKYETGKKAEQKNNSVPWMTIILTASGVVLLLACGLTFFFAIRAKKKRAACIPEK